MLKETNLNVDLFHGLDESVLNEILSLGITKNYNKNEIILAEKDKGKGLFIILKGKVKIARCEDSKEIVLALLGESNFFGEMSIIDGEENSATVTAVEDSEIFLLPTNDFFELLKKYPSIGISLLLELTNRLRAADIKIKALAIHDVVGRIATVLIELAEINGKIKQGDVEIQLPHQHEIANMAGTSRESVSRVIHQLADKELLKIDGSRLKIFEYEKFKKMYV